ncbi:alpha/beta fold hydrolase [Paraburkholderia caballeronis]|uniref:Pimeloyl-ACP methyl ester carboxylesterase n=1 Tax=Paraburkholderia caballeronis TaxID=416943 RepID=A0A1H7L881_9BURK|nr:alpha/beta hydrolase [Paraburkholderia caballeronis]PXW28311.1 pimeloyl-ACP methyl ester carboxylesterase [Paraburkholderia caballeronis]PXX03677.1 pimeloyl-ACP methyl ester carboxylesterase [Paraburkholderia caballeronis]RAK04421.1 pimeloyl-ACP methyl ester carboxylesterase [Paraburkholderia caballeronis]SED80864.1 Pimeloyl-ACP methyl ester carboxylesterase [Paraburkholderia caballeronis]SEK94467.1 Pimeloyl-ACP methyl ester carboxylesterase [Paraburkholderia caballeronis]
MTNHTATDTDTAPVVHHTVTANGIRQHYLDAGTGPAVVLLHGFPETSIAWRHQIGVLAQQYRVIAPDLRGYGATEKPASGYDKRNMALDIACLLDELRIDRIALVGHDRGARVATRFAKDHSRRLVRLAVLDNVPTRMIARRMNADTARAYWFFLFHLVPDLPEALIEGKVPQWLRYFFSDWCYNPHAIDCETFAQYVEAYQSPGALRGAMSDYRANAADVAQDLIDADVKISCPTMAIWGEEFHAVGQMFDMKAVWDEMAMNLRAEPISRCGHLPHEEQPDRVNELLLDFLSPWKE